MRQNYALTLASLLTVVLFTVHLAHDIIYGLDTMTRAGTLVYLLIVLVPTLATLELRGRRMGYAITLLLGLLAIGIPILHNVGGPRAASRGFAFVWVLLLMAASGGLTFVLSALELWRSYRGARIAAMD